MAKKKPAPTKVDSIRRKDKRKNIPAEELRDSRKLTKLISLGQSRTKLAELLAAFRSLWLNNRVRMATDGHRDGINWSIG